MAERDVAMFELGLRDYGTSWTRLQEALNVQQQLYGPAKEKAGPYIESRENDAPVSEKQVSPSGTPKKGKQPSLPVSRTASSESEKSAAETSPKAAKPKGFISLITRSKDSNTGKKPKKGSKCPNESPKSDEKDRKQLAREKRIEPEDDNEETMTSRSAHENGKEDRESAQDDSVVTRRRSSHGNSRRHGRPSSPDHRKGQHEYSSKDSPSNEYPREHVVKEKILHQKEKYDRVIKEFSRDESSREYSRKDTLPLSPSNNKGDCGRGSRTVYGDEGFKEHPTGRPVNSVEERSKSSNDERPMYPPYEEGFGREEFIRKETSSKSRSEKSMHARRSKESSKEEILADHSQHRRHSQEASKDEDHADKSAVPGSERRMNLRLSREQSKEDETLNKSPTSRELPAYPKLRRESSKSNSPNDSNLLARDDRLEYARSSRDMSRNDAPKEHRIVSPPRGQQRNTHTNGDYPRHYEPPPGRDHIFRFSNDTTRESTFVDYRPPSPNTRNSQDHAPESKGESTRVNKPASPSSHKTQQEYRRVSRETSRDDRGKDPLDDDEELMMMEPTANPRPRQRSHTEQQIKSPPDAPKPQVMRCIRCCATVYPMELVTPKPGVLLHSGCFKCRECGVKLTLQTYFTNQRDTRDSDVYCRTHQPRLGPGTVDGNALNILTSKNSKDIKFSRYSKGSDAEILLSSKVISQKDDFDVMREENGGLRYI
uniref:Putative microtubule-associated protein futsch n=1 Tax=Ornithodoros turicata TaxID=34597 RepID=A0A2R5L8Y0_9ACAR